VEKRLYSPHRNILSSSAVSEVDFTFKARIQILCLTYIMYVYIGMWVCVCMCITCALFAFMERSASIFCCPCPKAEEIPGSLYTDLSKLCSGLSKSTSGQSEFQNYVASSDFQEGKQEAGVFFLITKPSEPFVESFELPLNVICLMFGSVKGEAVR